MSFEVFMRRLPFSVGQGWRRVWSLPLAVGVCAFLFLRPAQLVGQGVTYHVSTSGSDANPGTQAKPLRTPQKAVTIVRPGDTILVHAGTYSGIVKITRSGAAGKPITLRSAGDGVVTLTAPFSVEACSRTSPTTNRTLQIVNGTDYWTIQNLVIVNGVLVGGTNFNDLTPYIRDRTLPGRGLYDPDAARTTLESLGSDGADHIQILDSILERRGIYTWAARQGSVERTVIRNIDCGTGGGIWLGRFNDEWVIRGNHIHDIAESVTHSMTEGVRTAANSMYNLVEYNDCERLAGLGRCISTDANAGWNVVRHNRAAEADIGFSEQYGGWGNLWEDNVSENNRRYGFRSGPGVYTPTENTPRYVTMRRNKSINDYISLSIGSATDSVWEDNDFSTLVISPPFSGYWPYAGNRLDPNLQGGVQ